MVMQNLGVYQGALSSKWMFFLIFVLFCWLRQTARLRLQKKCSYRKIPKISPSKYKPPKPVTQKPVRLMAPPNISPPGACTWKIALK